MELSLWEKINPPTGQRRNRGESLPCERQWQRLCRLCKAGPFFLQWITPPIEWTSLHWRTYNVDLEPVYDLHPITNSPCQRLWHRHNVSSFFFSFLLIFFFLFFFSFFFFFFFFIFFILLHFFFFCSFFLFFFSFSGHFSYGESPRTPPLEGTSLHRRNNSVERPWGILSLFMTCFQLRVN